jgi:single-strand DNA-binding protein
MASFNKVVLMGNLTRDPQMKYLPNSQTAITEFGIAMNRKYKTSSGEQREEVTFVDCTAWGRPAEVINQYCQKGKMIHIDGRLKLDTWDDKNGGGKRSKITVVVENFVLMGGGQQQGEGGQQQSRPAGKGKPAPRKGPTLPRPEAEKADEPFDDNTGEQFGEEDIPF